MKHSILSLLFVLLSISKLTSSQNVPTTPVQQTTVRRTTPPRLPLSTASPPATTTTTTVLPTPRVTTPAVTVGNVITTTPLQNTPPPVNNADASLPNTPTPGVRIASLPNTPVAPTNNSNLPNTPVPNNNGLPPTPAPAGSVATLAPTPAPAGSVATLPPTPNAQGGNNLPVTPAPPNPISLPVTPTPSILASLPRTPDSQQGVTSPSVVSLPVTPPPAITPTIQLPITPAPVASTPNSNVVTPADLPLTPVQMTSVLTTAATTTTVPPLITTPTLLTVPAMVTTPMPVTVPIVPIQTIPQAATTPTQPVVMTTAAASLLTTFQVVLTTSQGATTTSQQVQTTSQQLQTTPQQVQTTSQQAQTTSQGVFTTSRANTITSGAANLGTPTAPFDTTPTLRATAPPPVTGTMLVSFPPQPSGPLNTIADNTDVNMMFLYCNDYKLTVPSSNLQIYLLDLKSKMVARIRTAGVPFSESRITNFRLNENIDNGKITLEFTISPGVNGEIRNSEVARVLKGERMIDQQGNVFDATCQNYNVISWKENWTCVDRQCEHGGYCMVKSNGRYECVCASGYVGRYCEHNMWILFVLMALFLLAALAVLFYCLCFRRRKRIVVKNFVSPAVEEAVVRKKEEHKERAKPLQTFYLPYNKPLSVGFTDAQVGNIGVSNNGFQMIGTPVMGLQQGGGVGLQGIGLQAMNISGGLGGGTNMVLPVGIMQGGNGIYPIINQSVNQDPDVYYQSMGQNMALAYNDYTFMPNPRSSTVGNAVFSGQQGRNSCYSASFASVPADDNVANDGSGYYHRLGQKLAIKFDEN